MEDKTELDGTKIELMITNEKTGTFIFDGHNTKTAIVNDENILNITTDDKESEDVMMDNQKVTNAMRNNIQGSQQNFLRRAYAAQFNRPKESYMQYLPSEKFWPRDLRKVGCASGEKETLEADE